CKYSPGGAYKNTVFSAIADMLSDYQYDGVPTLPEVTKTLEVLLAQYPLFQKSGRKEGEGDLLALLKDDVVAGVPFNLSELRALVSSHFQKLRDCMPPSYKDSMPPSYEEATGGRNSPSHSSDEDSVTSRATTASLGDSPNRTPL